MATNRACLIVLRSALFLSPVREKLENGRTTARLRICWEPMRDRTGWPGGGSTTSTQDGMIAECQRANAEPPRQRDTALAPCGSDYADRLTAAVRDGRPGYRCFGWKLVVRQIGPSAARTRRSRTFAGSPPKCRVDKPALSGGEQNAGAAPFDKCPSSGSLRQSLILRSWRRCFQAARRGQSGRCFGQHRASDAR